MSITIETKKLQNLLNKAIKGSSQNKIYPLTNLICLDCKDGMMYLYTTDMDNYLMVADTIGSEIVHDEFYAVVGIELFYKLISKLTCEFVKMEIVDDVLIVEGNGKYKITLPLNEEGMPIKFPTVIQDFDYSVTEPVILEKSVIDKILTVAKASLLKSSDSSAANIICYTGYYVADKIISTDSNVMCCIDVPVFDTPVLISSELMELLGLFDIDVSVYMCDGYAVFKADNMTVYGVFMDKQTLEEYKVEDILPLFDLEYNSSCKVSQNDFVQILDRLSLFVGPYDDGQIKLTFSNNDILIESKQLDSAEHLVLQSLSNFVPFSCLINVQSLYEQVKSYNNSNINIYYSEDIGVLKFVSDEITQLIALENED